MSDAIYSRIAASALVAILCGMVLFASAGPAAADFRLCNNTGSRVGVAVGYKDADGWTTEGWWNLPSRTCETVLKGNLVARYYYVYAIDYDHGGEWMGQAFMCTRDREFTIRGVAGVRPGGALTVVGRRESGEEVRFEATVRLDSETDLDYYRNGGILQMVLRQLTATG